MTARRQALSPRGHPPRRSAAAHPLRAGYIETALGAVLGSVVGGWVGEWAGSLAAANGDPDSLSAAPLLIGIAVGLWVGAIAGATLLLFVRRRPLVWPTAIGLAVAWPALASAVGALQTMLGMGPSFVPYLVSTLIAGLAARFVVLRVLGSD